MSQFHSSNPTVVDLGATILDTQKSYAVPSLSLSFASDVQVNVSDDLEGTVDGSISGSSSGRRSSGRDRIHHYSPYPQISPKSPRRSPHADPVNNAPHSPPEASLPPSSIPVPNPNNLFVEDRRHRRTTSDSRVFQTDFAQMMSESEKNGGSFLQALYSESESRQSGATSDQFSAPTLDTRKQEARHRRSKSDSASMKVISSSDGFRLVIPPQALQSLKDIDSPDHSVTVLLTRDGDLQSDDQDMVRSPHGDHSGMNKSSTRPKHYKCSKCGQPKKGHVCEYASDKPSRGPKGVSPRELQDGSPMQALNTMTMNGMMQNVTMPPTFDQYGGYHSNGINVISNQGISNLFMQQSMLPMHTQFPQSLLMRDYEHQVQNPMTGYANMMTDQPPAPVFQDMHINNPPQFPSFPDPMLHDNNYSMSVSGFEAIKVEPEDADQFTMFLAEDVIMDSEMPSS